MAVCGSMIFHNLDKVSFRTKKSAGWTQGEANSHLFGETTVTIRFSTMKDCASNEGRFARCSDEERHAFGLRPKPSSVSRLYELEIMIPQHSIVDIRYYLAVGGYHINAFREVTRYKRYESCTLSKIDPMVCFCSPEDG